ncbi:Hypothetical predicted protein [Paramuricea clavata]|uniref:Uncharacterized protein n=1 Tax=Paramuricea clavata TaxID=317549 RepID=A0A7D9D5Z0_PARCT|nr:Hypothetical predicted protein [Paramuricea clavata]
MNPDEISNSINAALLEPLQSYTPLDSVLIWFNSLLVLENDTFNALRLASDVTPKGGVKTFVMRQCILCMQNHPLASCQKFKEMKLKDRIDFVRKKELCFGCLGMGHFSNRCLARKKCDVCQLKHPTHGCNEDTTSSMILPVWLYHQEDPDHQIMVYALLDPASNGTFIKTETLNKLGRKGVDINLRLNTMHSREIITTQKITGLKVEDLERTTQIELPMAVYCRSDIPSRRSEIPHPEMANKWDHLCELTTKLPRYQERIEIGLLIGSNCPKAIKPQDVIRMQLELFLVGE